jgi:glycosyltransferase involved in cell wall biosynthesis
MTGVSVIICCYNSCSRIVSTLEHLAKQNVSVDVPWEVVLVNNASTDNTAELAKTTWEKLQLRVPLCIEDQAVPGLSFAREKGIDKASYEYLLFCDDDNWLDENYIQNVFTVMNSDDKIGALGGHGIPYFEIDPPKNILKYSGYYATGQQRAGTGEVGYPHVYGAGCTYRKSAIVHLFKNGFKYQLTGRNGDKLMCGEDHELCYALFLSGYKIWASDSLTFFHFIPASRITTEYIKRNIMGIAHSNFVLSVYKLIIANREKQRPSHKSKWEWILTTKGILVIANTVKKLKGYRIDELLKTELKAELYSFSLFLKNRAAFYNLLSSLSESKWISKPDT